MKFNHDGFNLYSFILWCYHKIDSSNLKDIAVLNNVWTFDPFIKNRKYSFKELCGYLESNDYIKELENPRFLTNLLLFIDSNIHYFDEYLELFIDNSSDLFANDHYYLIISPENSITKQIDKMVSLSNKKTKYGLRKQRDYNPRKTSHLLGFKNLHFIRKNNGFVIKQSFAILDGLSTNLSKGIVSITFSPFININKTGHPLYKINQTNNLFSIAYSKESEKLFDEYLTNEFNSSKDILILPELCNPYSNFTIPSNLLRGMNFDCDKLIICGSNWNNNDNKCMVFNDFGNLLVSQNKYNPYKFEENGSWIFENLSFANDEFEISLLHIKSFGLLAFPICSDLLSSKYIESIILECGVTTIISPCMSSSMDIFASLKYISSLYLVSIFACNAYIDDKNIIGYCSLPIVKKGLIKRSVIEKSLKCKKTKNGKSVNGISITLNLNKFI